MINYIFWILPKMCSCTSIANKKMAGHYTSFRSCFPLHFCVTLVLIFKISLTSGYLNGFLLFAQIFDSLFLIGKNIYLPPSLSKHFDQDCSSILQYFQHGFLWNRCHIILLMEKSKYSSYASLQIYNCCSCFSVCPPDYLLS